MSVTVAQFIELIEREIQSNLAGYGLKTSHVSSQADETSGTIFASSFIYYLEHGRGPTKNSTPGKPTLRERILEWIQFNRFQFRDQKGKFMSYETMAFLISRRIHRDGSKLFRSGTIRNIYSNVITEDRVNSFIKAFAKEKSALVQSDIINIFKNVNTQ